jgi:hypothetical protein
MKKILYILLLSILACGSMVSCTEEEVKPQTESNNGGGSPIKE